MDQFQDLEMKNSQSSTFDYKYENRIAEYRITVSELPLLKRQFDFVFTDNLKLNINGLIDSWKEAKSKFAFTACLVEIASENGKYTLVPYRINISLIDFYISVVDTPTQLIIGYDSFEKYERDVRENKVKRFNCK